MRTKLKKCTGDTRRHPSKEFIFKSELSYMERAGIYGRGFAPPEYSERQKRGILVKDSLDPFLGKVFANWRSVELYLNSSTTVKSDSQVETKFWKEKIRTVAGVTQAGVEYQIDFFTPRRVVDGRFVYENGGSEENVETGLAVMEILAKSRDEAFLAQIKQLTESEIDSGGLQEPLALMELYKLV